MKAPPLDDSRVGKVFETFQSFVKEEQVERARQGSRDGLHDRVTLRGLPITYRELYGYTWDKPTRLVPNSDHHNLKLVPNADHPNLKLVFDLVLNQGCGYQKVIDELRRRDILSPSGMPLWNKQTLSGILHNPTYAGRFYALKARACEPTERPKKSKRVNSSQRRLQLEDAHYLPNIEVVDPPISWADRERIDVQLAGHQRLSQRHAKFDYLLRGLIVCGVHRGKQGELRRFHGRPHRGSFAYVCPASTPADKCSRPFLRGPELDAAVKLFVKMLFSCKADDIVARNVARRRSMEDLDRELQDLDAKYQRKTAQLATMEWRLLDGKVDQDTCDLVKVRLLVERKGIVSRQNELLGEKAEVGRGEAARESLRELSMKYSLRVLDTELSTTEWRELFVALTLSIRVEAEDPGLSYGRRGYRPLLLSYGRSGYLLGMPVIFEVGLPLSALPSLSFASADPEVDGHNKPYHLRLSGKEVIELAEQYIACG